MENASIEEAAKILQNSQGVVQLRIRKDEHFNGERSSYLPTSHSKAGVEGVFSEQFENHVNEFFY